MTKKFEIEIELDSAIEFEEFSKIISFISEDIASFSYESERLSLVLTKADNYQRITEDIKKLSLKYIKRSPEPSPLFCITKERDYFSDFTGEDYESAIHVFHDGMIGLNEKAIFIYEYFDKKFECLALDFGAKKKRYPVLLPMESYHKTGYLNTSPQYSIFCCSPSENISVLNGLSQTIKDNNLSDILTQPQFALSPSACFHTYLEYENKTLSNCMIFTFIQSVFRNEGRLNYTELSRLRDYHVREVVFIGNIDFVLEIRNELFEKTKNLLIQLDLCGEGCVATDPFILPKMQKYKKVQLLEETKYEVKLNYDGSNKLSAASFNLHGNAFTHPFNIKVSGCDDTVTGCVGFGLERWVIAFLCQFGMDEKNWPKNIREEFLSGKC